MSWFKNDTRRESTRRSMADAQAAAAAATPPAELIDTLPPGDDDIQDAVVVAESRAERPPVPGATHHDEDGGDQLAPLFGPETAQDLRARWDATQIGFVDDPRRAVKQADELVAEVTKTLAESFAAERQQLEAQLNDETASTESLRVALQRYRSFFQRLLSL